MKKYIFLFISLLISILGYGQQLNQLSQRHFDMLEYNPSVCGSKLYSELKLHHRSQWVGFEGAPQTQIISFNGTLGKKAGIGAYIINDNIHISNQLTGSLNYSYHIAFYGFNLSMGVGFAMSRFKLNGSKLNLETPGDIFIPEIDVTSHWFPQASAGLFAYNSNFYLGFSFANMIKSQLFDNMQSQIPNNQTLFLIGAYNFEISRQFELIPNFVVSKSFIEPINIEVGLKSSFMENFFLGVTYRHLNSVIASTGFIFKRFALIYSYDYLISSISPYSDGSHEIVLQFQIPYSNKKTARLFEIDNKAKNHLFLKW